jgi:hypothetical protein
VTVGTPRQCTAGPKPEPTSRWAGHIHLPYVTPPFGFPRRLWSVQAGTAQSRRVRGGQPKSVKLQLGVTESLVAQDKSVRAGLVGLKALGQPPPPPVLDQPRGCRPRRSGDFLNLSQLSARATKWTSGHEVLAVATGKLMQG